MKNILLRYGILAGFISLIGFHITLLSGHDDFENGMLYGYASMLAGFSLIYVAVKNYRDKHNAGVITFGKAFKIGLYITLIASTIYVIVWLIDYFFFIPDFGEKYMAYYISELKASGASQTEINAKMEEMKTFGEYYKNPFINALITYSEILPVGLLVSLITAALIKKQTQLNQI